MRHNSTQYACLSALAVALFGGIIAQSAAARAETNGPAVTIYVCSDATVPTFVLRNAQSETGKIFASMGVPIRWRQGRPKAGAEKSPTTVEISVEAEVQPGFRPASLAFANPERYGVLVHVFYNRIAAIYRPDEVYIVLGYVMAHEMGHVLEGVSRHSEDGILKAHWTLRDYEAMVRGALAFAPEDVGMIQRYVTAAAAEHVAKLQ